MKSLIKNVIFLSTIMLGTPIHGALALFTCKRVALISEKNLHTTLAFKNIKKRLCIMTETHIQNTITKLSEVFNSPDNFDGKRHVYEELKILKAHKENAQLMMHCINLRIKKYPTMLSSVALKHYFNSLKEATDYDVQLYHVLRNALKQQNDLQKKKLNNTLNTTNVLDSNVLDIVKEYIWADLPTHHDRMSRALKEAIDNDNADYLWHLIYSDCSLYNKDELGMTALERAIALGKIKSVKVLLDYGISGLAQNMEQYIALAQLNNRAEVATLLSNKTKEFDTYFDGKHETIDDSDDYNILRLVHLGLEPQRKQTTFWSTIEDAINLEEKGHVQALLEHKADANYIGLGTPLLERASRNLEIAKLLLDYKADPNAKNTNSGEPLIATAQKYNPNFAKLLLEYNADPNAKSNCTRLEEMVTRHAKSLADVLKKRVDDLLKSLKPNNIIPYFRSKRPWLQNNNQRLFKSLAVGVITSIFAYKLGSFSIVILQ